MTDEPPGRTVLPFPRRREEAGAPADAALSATEATDRTCAVLGGGAMTLGYLALTVEEAGAAVDLAALARTLRRLEADMIAAGMALVRPGG